MGEYHIIGGNQLSGELRIGGGKNAILPILASVVLNQGESIIHNCPNISDTLLSIKILESIGCKVRMEGSTMIVDSSTANNHEIPEQLVREMRSSIIFLGGVLGRFNKVKISYPGGCNLGERPINLHIEALKEFAVDVKEEFGFLVCETKGLKAARISLNFPSVGATENIMLTATLAEGETIISNAAREPEIVDLEKFLNGMGANIKGAGTDTIVINGVKKLHSVEHYLMPDRIVAGTFLVGAAMTRGKLLLTDVVPRDLYPFTSKLEETGCYIKVEADKIFLSGPERLNPIKTLMTYPHPGFPTDMQAQFMALLCIANGTSVIKETVFESRNKHIGELIRMGANIISHDAKNSTIIGVKKLNGTTVTSRDLRGGAALILAGLAAEGKTAVIDDNHVKRGYEDIEVSLSQIGGKINYFAK